jgi:hypothetical protein
VSSLCGCSPLIDDFRDIPWSEASASDPGGELATGRFVLSSLETRCLLNTLAFSSSGKSSRSRALMSLAGDPGRAMRGGLGDSVSGVGTAEPALGGIFGGGEVPAAY